MHPLAGVWPLFGLSVQVGDLELRYPTDADLAALAALAADGVHDPAVMPFSTPWTDAPPEKRAQGTVRWHWQTRATWSPDLWRLSLATVIGGQVVGTQDLAASSFAVTLEVESGSWLGRRFQGSGIGTRMRAAVLDLAFTGLGAATARS
ncbi:MAG: GNAT family N-acetyltransferase, partial [Actinomycetes bacterium]